ncbi:MAG TPA: phytanoyl-CoA dioxygenase family protein [Candidatus Sumerlaeota bacterium]|nr:MAG: Kanamycin B dioxygenase [candidate division BRC1 bacterium ADurb.BinA292]HPK03513.1 phytanoyl-CoA dioxygenase family protein [Candidatus Sumerlaeota bacterium]
MNLNEMAAFYREHGYLLAEGLLTPAEVEAMREEADATIERMSRHQQEANNLWKGNWLKDEERAQQRLNAVHDMQFQAAIFGKLLFNDKLLDIAEALIGPNVQLHHTKMLAKPPEKGGAFPMHQDYPYFPHQNHTMFAVSIYLDDADEENGCIRVMPGSHKLGPLECDPGGFYLPPEKYPIEEGLPVKAKAGDGVIFNYLTIHGSSPNRSGRPRRNILIQMRDPSDPPTRDIHASRGQGLMLRGINPVPVPAAWAAERKAAAGVS